MRARTAPITCNCPPLVRHPLHPCLLLKPVHVYVPQCNMPRAKGLSSRPKKKKPEWLADPASEKPDTTEKIDGARDEGTTSARQSDLATSTTSAV